MINTTKTTMKQTFLNYLGNSPQTRVLQFLIEGRELDYSMTDLLGAKVSWRTLHLLIPELLKTKLIKKTRTIGRATLYQINKEHPIAQQLIKIYDDTIFQNSKP